MTRRALFATLLCVVARAGDAQTIRGVVVDRGETPVPGVIVMLLDARSSVVARSLTNESGEYRVTASQPGTFRIRTLRIGFKPATSDVIALVAGQEMSRRVTLDDIPVSLETVTVTSKNACSIRADTAEATFGVWEQVRAALTAAQLTSGNRALTARFIAYTRSLEAGRRGRVLKQHAVAREGMTTRPFKALPADSLSRVGYVGVDLSRTTTYYAPDIDVLLSDVFIDDHCLRISKESDATHVAIAFEPTFERTNIPEIRGTIWVDRRTSELRRLRYDYVNLTREQREGNPAGEMEFVRLTNGLWMISRWNIRMPLVESRPNITGVVGALHGGTAEQFFVREIRVEGGDLTFVRRRGETLWSRAPLMLAGVVRDSSSNAAVAGATVELRGSDQADTTDANGRFAIDEVLPGEYLLDVRGPSHTQAGAAYTVPFVFVDTTTTATVRLPTAEQMLRGVCGATAPTQGIVAGVARMDRDTTPLRNALVVATWPRFQVHGENIIETKHIAEVRTDAQGSFRFCTVPVNTRFTLRAASDRGAAEPVEHRIPDGQRFLTADVVLLPAGANASLGGSVVSSTDRRPIVDAEVALSGVPRRMYTDSTGGFQFVGVPAGTHELTVRKVGFKPSAESVAVRDNDRLRRSVTLSPVQTLEAVQVEGAVISSFEEHRRIGQGTFITRAELARAAGRKTSEMLATVPGLSMVRGSSRAWVYSSRARTTGRPANVDRADMQSGARQGVCYAHVYIDQVQVYGSAPKIDARSRSIPEPLFDVNSIPPNQIEAIEYYASPAQVPVKYARIGSQCGVLVIHTRRP